MMRCATQAHSKLKFRGAQTFMSMISYLLKSTYVYFLSLTTPSPATRSTTPNNWVAPTSGPTATSRTCDQVLVSGSASNSLGRQGEGVVDSIDEAQVLKDSASLASYFAEGLEDKFGTGAEGEDDVENKAGENVDDEEDDDGEGLGSQFTDVDTPGVKATLAFADQFILETRCKGGRQTEHSVLKQWKVRNSSRNPSVLH